MIGAHRKEDEEVQGHIEKDTAQLLRSEQNYALYASDTKNFTRSKKNGTNTK